MIQAHHQKKGDKSKDQRGPDQHFLKFTLATAYDSAFSSSSPDYSEEKLLNSKTFGDKRKKIELAL